MAQTEIPVGNEIGRKHDPDEEYERVFGTPAAARQRLAYVEARRCTCGSAFPREVGRALEAQAALPASRKEVLVSADLYDAVQDARSDRSEWTEGLRRRSAGASPRTDASPRSLAVSSSPVPSGRDAHVAATPSPRPSEFDLQPGERKLSCGCYVWPCGDRWQITGQAFLCDRDHRMFQEVDRNA